ncbi:MAG: DedA family protein [Spirochaetes bacterium]|nr:DedA family protein [Spirochaetota bacterium]
MIAAGVPPLPPHTTERLPVMEQLVNDIIEFLLPKNDLFLYIFLFLSAMVENLFPPVPGDTVTAFGAFLVGTGRLSYLLVYAVTTIGSVFGFMVLVLLGRVINREFFIKRDYSFFSAKSILDAERWFSRYGLFVVLANRFMPGIRSVISLVAGISRLNLAWVLLLATLSASVWNLIWIHAGFMLGNNWEAVREKAGHLIRQYNIAAGIVISLLILLAFLYRRRSARRSREDGTASAVKNGDTSDK